MDQRGSLKEIRKYFAKTKMKLQYQNLLDATKTVIRKITALMLLLEKDSNQ
jgi:hypothetical protein